jgi:hypothetical protein
MSEGRILNEGGKSSAVEKIPKSFLCPITGEVFTDPVLAKDGYTYERSAITRWLISNHKSPLTHQPLSLDDLQANITLKALLDEWGVCTDALASIHLEP